MDSNVVFEASYNSETNDQKISKKTFKKLKSADPIRPTKIRKNRNPTPPRRYR